MLKSISNATVKQDFVRHSSTHLFSGQEESKDKFEAGAGEMAHG